MAKKTKRPRSYSRQEGTGRNIQASNRRHDAAEERIAQLEREVHVLGAAIASLAIAAQHAKP